MFYFTIEEGGLYMDKQIFLDKFKELGTCEDDVQRRDILASLTDDISSLYSDILPKGSETLRLHSPLPQDTK